MVIKRVMFSIVFAGGLGFSCVFAVEDNAAQEIVFVEETVVQEFVGPSCQAEVDIEDLEALEAEDEDMLDDIDINDVQENPAPLHELTVAEKCKLVAMVLESYRKASAEHILRNRDKYLCGIALCAALGITYVLVHKPALAE